MANLPYVLTVAALEKLLDKIQTASVPDKFSQDFVTTKLGIKGGSGRALIPFMKKMGFVSTDGQPTQRYHEFRNPEKSGAAIAVAIKELYETLFEMNEYANELGAAALKNLIVEATGSEPGSSAVQKTVSTISTLLKLADFDALQQSTEADNLQDKQADLQNIEQAPSLQNRTSEERHESPHQNSPLPTNSGEGINLSYTINLNLPATKDIEVFNAIFKSLKQHLIQS